MTRTRLTKGYTSDEASAFECVFCANGDKMQAKCNKMPEKYVYLLENLHFLQFFVADSVTGSIILCKGDRLWNWIAEIN